jgi:ATP/maltotriose-dependent transcriptional regulator MalT
LLDTFELLQLLESEDDEATRQLFEKRIDDGLIFEEMLQRSSGWLYVIAILAETCAALDDGLRAQSLYAHLVPYDGLNTFARYALFSMGATAHYLGLLAATMGERDRAEDHFARALEQNERWGFRPAAGYTRYEWARMLINRSDAAELERARGMLNEALGTARQIGMVRLERLAKTLIEGISAPDKLYPAGLSPREVEVLELVTQGLTNAEVGEQLFISPRTVSQHLRSVYNKLGVNSRTAAVARWIELSRD